jgi:hypothetical protein
VHSEENSTSVVQDEPSSKVCPLTDNGDDETNSDSDIDLEELSQALEQATTLASHSKKQNRTKHRKKIAKIPVAKKLIYDSTTPGYKFFISKFFRLFSLLLYFYII